MYLKGLSFSSRWRMVDFAVTAPRRAKGAAKAGHPGVPARNPVTGRTAFGPDAPRRTMAAARKSHSAYFSLGQRRRGVVVCGRAVPSARTARQHQIKSFEACRI